MGHKCKCKKHDLQGNRERGRKCKSPFRKDGKIIFCKPAIRFCGQLRAFESCGSST